jgi:hypothetical protein
MPADLRMIRKSAPRDSVGIRTDRMPWSLAVPALALLSLLLWTIVMELARAVAFGL